MQITKSNKRRTSLDLHKTKRGVGAHLLLSKHYDVLHLQLRNLQITWTCMSMRLSWCQESFLGGDEHVYIDPVQRTSCYPLSCPCSIAWLIRSRLGTTTGSVSDPFLHKDNVHLSPTDSVCHTPSRSPDLAVIPERSDDVPATPADSPTAQ
jgi:hypothetical protein